jgi:NADH-quinone oxidoreductase subunit M
MAALRQLDIKRIIAYSSIAHMNLITLGIFTYSIEGISGAIFLMISHGIVSSGLFFSAGVLYDNYGSRLISYYGGLIRVMPLFSAQLFIFCLGNIGFPGTCNFIGELLIFASLASQNFFLLFVSVSGVIFSVLYTMFLYNRLVFGNLNVLYINCYKDLSKREIYILTPLLFLTIFLGIFPNVILDTVLSSVSVIVECGKLV